MIRLILWRVLAFFLARYELISAPKEAPHNGEPYLSRWHFPRWLARRYGAEYLFLHYFHQSDPDRGWHNHPWEWCESELLSGSYLQEIFVRNEFVRRLGGSPLWHQTFRRGDRNMLYGHFHKVILLGRPVWTLFRAGPKHGRGWGFVDERGNFTNASGT